MAPSVILPIRLLGQAYARIGGSVVYPGGHTGDTVLDEQLRYSLAIQWSDDDQVYVVSFPEWEAHGLIGHTHGVTYAEAVQKGQEVLHLLVTSACADGESLPTPRTFLGAEQAS